MKPEVMAGGLHQPEWLAEGYLNILKNALHMLYYNWGLPVLAFFILTFLFSLFVKESRYITIFFVIPPLILWMFKYSADFRNLSFVVPFISYVSAFGLFRITEIITNKKQNDNLLTPLDRTESLQKNKIWRSIAILLVGVIGFLLIRTDYLYQILYSTYSFISNYYFQSNRITYLIDYTNFINVDYYQKVFGTMFLLIAVGSLLHILKSRVRDILGVLALAAVFLNFTFITKHTILSHQIKEFAKVDARNYYQTINTLIKSTGLNDMVFTNFKAICSEKIKRNVEFGFIETDRLLDSLEGSSEIELRTIFLKLKDLENPQVKRIRNLISSKKFQILYDNRDYIFISS
jgi:hypothetical protein